MTVKELYSFAFDNCLLNEEVSEVINKYTSQQIQPTIFDIDKVEYTYEDIIALFSL